MVRFVIAMGILVLAGMTQAQQILKVPETSLAVIIKGGEIVKNIL